MTTTSAVILTLYIFGGFFAMGFSEGLLDQESRYVKLAVIFFFYPAIALFLCCYLLGKSLHD